jgi:Fic family protein
MPDGGVAVLLGVSGGAQCELGKYPRWNTEVVTDLDELTAGLAGSPYSLPDDPSQRGILLDALARATELEGRCRDVRAKLAAEPEQRLRRLTRTSEIFESNAIEGKTVTLRETKEILDERHMWDAGQAIARYTLMRAFQDDPKVRDVVGLAAARILVDEYMIDSVRPLTETDLRDFHGLILAGDPSAGRYKQYLNRIEGSPHTPAPPVEVPGAMHALLTWLQEAHLPVVWKSAAAHAWLTHIHPFDDGNGRIARLLANYVLGAGSYPPIIVKSTSDRPRYLQALSHSDEAGDISALVRLFLRVLNRGVEFMERPQFAWELFQADLLVREQDIYVRWQKTIARFFEEVAARLLLSRKSLSIVGEISASDYALLCKHDRSGNAWFAKAFASEKVADLLIWVGYTSDRMQRLLELDQVFPSFFVSERDLNPRAIKPYRSVGDNEPLFDELCVIADEERALFRRGDRVQRVSLVDAAELFSALLATYLDDLPYSSLQALIGLAAP